MLACLGDAVPFFWGLEAQLASLGHHLHGWAAEALGATRKRGEGVRIGVDGQQVIGSKRVRRGEKARALLSAYGHEIGVSLTQRAVEADEAKTALNVIASLQGLEGVPWLFTGDAAFAERPLVETVLDKGACRGSTLKTISQMAKRMPSGPLA